MYALHLHEHERTPTYYTHMHTHNISLMDILSLVRLFFFNQGWRFNVVMVLISMFYGMMLTNWGDINTDGESSDPKNGWTAMWLTTTGQWVCFIIYGWTLVAPLVFPDRDFS